MLLRSVQRRTRAHCQLLYRHSSEELSRVILLTLGSCTPSSYWLES